MRYAAVLLLLLLSGCAQFTWVHPQGLDSSQLLAAQQECRQLAYSEARYHYFYYSGFHRGHFYPFYRPYYHDLMWHDHHRQMRYQDDLNRFYRFCMEAKGWRLQRVDPDTSPADSPRSRQSYGGG